MYYTLTLLSLTAIIIFLAIRHRATLVSRLPPSIQSHLPPLLQPSPSHGGAAYRRLPVFDWGTARDAGLHSTLFDIEANINDGDTRSGLDQRGAEEVTAIMHAQGVSFDEARLIRHQNILRQNNIDPHTGMPLDSKAVLSLGASSRR
ncbi:hypothetical protein K437DRAFT_129994 [Tilletiaria anomala UBC 951]|uniref:Uncharacterized protein n=1 Tax=Tilletiaria anomala (strain ATCC 24038 / CBS 436.72 / UBC 951) TaxID=1037660 RepID=A0A066VWU2_TILAU|nr:uncharacterized protein K437DRAFT_129994 [Tilletiaria anomala UBC 951]KDN44753.1 hypothetical protein K437DRAFT_129994 [Tilletiaria anomala UBC 951]